MPNNTAEYYDKRYYTLDRLSAASLFVVKTKLKQFMRDFDITEYPLDCFALLEKIERSGKIKLGVRTVQNMSSKFDATSTYFPEIDEYLIMIPPVPENWKEHSAWRRRNFTLAHELAHIFCGHLIASRNMKSSALQDRENDEADEFAGQLLMPEHMILQSHFSGGDLSAEYLVSDQALFKRLNNLKRLDLFNNSAKATCPKCGNDHISPIADYCEICGAFLPAEGRNGVRTVQYPRMLALKNNRVMFCPVCGNEEYSQNAVFCRICGTHAYNICGSTDPFLDCNHVNSINARYCELCGSKTVYNIQNLLPDWQSERDEYIRAITQE